MPFFQKIGLYVIAHQIVERFKHSLLHFFYHLRIVIHDAGCHRNLPRRSAKYDQGNPVLQSEAQGSVFHDGYAGKVMVLI